MAWRLANSLNTLRNQINYMYPNRSKASDGTIGDAAHAGTVSDHNPNDAGVVTAIDITHDPANGLDIEALANTLAQSRDNRIKYVIANSKIFTSVDWTWQPYNGDNPHDKHIHISVNGNYDDSREWQLTGGDPDMAAIGYDTANQIHQDLIGQAWNEKAWQTATGGKLTFSQTYSLVANSQSRRDYQNYIANLEKQAAGSTKELITFPVYKDAVK